jgi:hypothetical protein
MGVFTTDQSLLDFCVPTPAASHRGWATGSLPAQTQAQTAPLIDEETK